MIKPINSSKNSWIKNQRSISFGTLSDENSYLIKSIGYNHDIDSIETYSIDTTFSLAEEELHLIGAIGSTALGYHYIFYDMTHKQWLTYHNWGIPTLEILIPVE